MDIIKELQKHEKDQLDAWLNYDEKETKKFLKGIVKFADQNPDAFKNYCKTILPSEYSSLSIIYEGLSEYATHWNAFLFEEIKRVVLLAKNKQIDYKYLDILTDIETEDIYSKSEEIYIEIINFLTSQLQHTNPHCFNIELLEVLSWYLIEYDEDDDIAEVNDWIQALKSIADHENTRVKLKAREVLKDLDSGISLPSISFFEKIKSLFK